MIWGHGLKFCTSALRAINLAPPFLKSWIRTPLKFRKQWGMQDYMKAGSVTIIFIIYTRQNYPVGTWAKSVRIGVVTCKGKLICVIL